MCCVKNLSGFSRIPFISKSEENQQVKGRELWPPFVRVPGEQVPLWLSSRLKECNPTGEVTVGLECSRVK
jgi:hypothetical protein